MPGPVHITKGSDLKTSGGQTEGMIRQNAIVDLADDICASVMTAKPHTASGIHHHGKENTIAYCTSGRGTIVSEGGNKTQHLGPGDFALIPAFAEHQERNDGDEDLTLIITRSGRNPIVENIEGWGKS